MEYNIFIPHNKQWPTSMFSGEIIIRYDQDRRGLQRFIGAAPWDFMPLERELVSQVAICNQFNFFPLYFTIP